MKRRRVLMLLAVITVMFTNCTTTKRIQKNMNTGQYSLAYLHDSEENNEKNNVYVNITDVYNHSSMNDTTKVKRLKGWVVPLIFINIWRSENKCVQGKSMIEEDITNFIKTSLANEINRSGSFNTDTLNTSEYSIKLTINEIKTEGPYVSSGYFYFALYVYGYSFSDIAGPAISTMKINYQLYKGEVIVLENTIDTRQMTQPIIRRYNNDKFLQRDYSISMVEAVSFNIKKVNEQIVKELNQYFNNL